MTTTDNRLIEAEVTERQARAFATIAEHLTFEHRTAIAKRIGERMAPPEPPTEPKPDAARAPLTVERVRARERMSGGPILTRLERELLTPEHVNNSGHIALADYLFARGHRDIELHAILPVFEVDLLTYLREVETIVPRCTIRPAGETPRIRRFYLAEWRPLIDRFYADSIEALLLDLGFAESAKAARP